MIFWWGEGSLTLGWQGEEGCRFLALANSALASLPPGEGSSGRAGIGGDLSQVGYWKWEVGRGMASGSGSGSPWARLQWHYQRKKGGGERVIKKAVQELQKK